MRWPFNHYVANHRDRLVYCAIPKTAGTSVRHWFLTVAGIEPPAPGEEFYAYRQKHGASLNIDVDENALRSADYFRFTFVRDPFRRLVSGYVNQFVQRDITKSVARAAVERIQRELNQPADLEAGVTFREFAAHIVRTPDDELNPHWRPQHLFLDDVQFDFIGRQEQLREGLDHVAHVANTPSNPPLAQLNVSRHDTGDAQECAADTSRGELHARAQAPSWTAFYDEVLRDAVHGRYVKDFELHARAGTPCEPTHT